MTVYVSDAVRAHLLAHPTQPIRAAAAALGLKPTSITTYRNALRRQGHALPRADGTRHDPATMEFVVDAIQRGTASHRVAQRYGMSRGALYQRLLRHADGVWASRRDAVYTTSDLARILGLAPITVRKRLTRWVGAGLEVRQGSIKARGRGALRLITANALMEWLARPDCPIRPERIADPDWRAFAEDARVNGYRAPQPAPQQRSEEPRHE